MNKKPHMGLIIVLLMFPQIIETIYSPILPHLVDYFDISMEIASQTLSIYFMAFAVGVVFWGRISDVIGRRLTMILGLLTYAIGCLLALTANNFDMVLFARVISAFGAAVGSVIGQTILRDSYEGKELGKVFSLVAVAISISPVVGLMTGGFLSRYFGHLVVFSLLLILAIVLFIVTVFTLPETKPANTQTVSFMSVMKTMLKDWGIWKNAIIIACFNTMMFSYYSLAPFMFNEFGLSSLEFGYSGVVLAIASMLGSFINKTLLGKHWSTRQLINVAVLLSVVGSIEVYLYQDNLWFLLGIVSVIAGFGIAIPNLFSTVLVNYKHQAGTAGAILGLMYYLLIAVGLGLAGIVQNLGIVLVTASVIVATLTIRKS